MLSKKWNYLLFSLFLLAVLARVLPGPRTIDDAYITFRYARNLLSGNGFVYNPGERVLGTTTPAFTLLLAAIGFFLGATSAPFPWITLFVNAIADGLTVIFLVRIGKKLGARLAGWGAGLAWAIAPFSVTFAIGGMETSLYIFGLVALFWSTLSHRYTLAATFAALALLTRPDALILILPLAIHRFYLISQKKAPWPDVKELTLFLLPILLWTTFAWNYFGNPIPQSILAKSEAYYLSPLDAPIRLLQHYATPFLGHLRLGQGWIKIGILLFPILALIGSWVAMRNSTRILAFIVFPWLYFLAFAIGSPLIFRWYMTPPLPFYFLFILVGAQRIITHAFSRLPTSAQSKSWLLQFVLIAIILSAPAFLQIADWELKPNHGPQRPAPNMAWIELELLYAKAAQELLSRSTNSEATATLAAADVGVLGFSSNMKILDLVGINTPETSEYLPLSPEAYAVFPYAVPTEIILDQQPDYIVILEIYGRDGLLSNSDFQSHYQLVNQISTDIYGSQGMLIFERVE